MSVGQRFILTTSWPPLLKLPYLSIFDNVDKQTKKRSSRNEENALMILNDRLQFVFFVIFFFVSFFSFLPRTIVVEKTKLE